MPTFEPGSPVSRSSEGEQTILIGVAANENLTTFGMTIVEVGLATRA